MACQIDWMIEKLQVRGKHEIYCFGHFKCVHFVCVHFICLCVCARAILFFFRAIFIFLIYLLFAAFVTKYSFYLQIRRNRIYNESTYIYGGIWFMRKPINLTCKMLAILPFWRLCMKYLVMFVCWPYIRICVLLILWRSNQWNI